MIIIQSDQQKKVDDLRIDLAQAKIDLAEVRVVDIHSQYIKERVFEGLRKICAQLDALGVMHASALRQHNVRP